MPLAEPCWLLSLATSIDKDHLDASFCTSTLHLSWQQMTCPNPFLDWDVPLTQWWHGSSSGNTVLLCVPTQQHIKHQHSSHLLQFKHHLLGFREPQFQDLHQLTV